MSSTPPPGNTTVNASTQSRVVPYLKVAAPAALVATIPPTNAPVKVGAGGAPDDRGGKGGRRRRGPAPGSQDGEQVAQCDASLDADRVGADGDNVVQTRRADENVAHGRRTARERGLRTNRQHGRRHSQC